MRFLLFIIVAVVSACSANRQSCECESKFEWVKKTFEENDAGFQYVIDKKGQATYNIHNQLTLEKVKTAKTLTECVVVLDEWLKFFRSGHIGIQCLTCGAPASQDTSQTTNETTWKGDISQFEKYISEKKEADLEGIFFYRWANQWATGTVKIGINKEGADYVGFFMETGYTWKAQQIMLKITQDGDKLNTICYLENGIQVEVGEPELIGNNYLQIPQFYVLKRLSPVFPDDQLVENYIKNINSQEPFLEELNVMTLYLRIPSFRINNKQAIDKILADNKEKILKTKNFIIDLRNNSGGFDATYAELLPFIYTNPIRIVGIERLSTTQNNQRFLEYSKEKYGYDEETRQWIKKTVDKLQDRLGKFANVDEDIEEYVTIKRYDNVYEYPKNVGIIINKGCASSTEEFLLAAKQSKKVKLFGTNTWGAQDISNILSIESPCKEFVLSYTMSRSLRIPDMVIDEVGLQPDYYIDKTIPKYKWVEFVNDILNQ